jgi:hypothetical protein
VVVQQNEVQLWNRVPSMVNQWSSSSRSFFNFKDGNCQHKHKKKFNLKKKSYYENIKAFIESMVSWI